MAWEGIEKPILGSPRMRRGERVRYVPNHRSFGAFMRSDQMRDVTADVAGDIATAAAAPIPESTGGENSTGLHSRVKHGFKVKRSAGLMKVGGNLRVRVDVVNSADGSALIEFGARGIARLRSLGRAGAAYGDFKPEDGPS